MDLSQYCTKTNGTVSQIKDAVSVPSEHPVTVVTDPTTPPVSPREDSTSSTKLARQIPVSEIKLALTGQIIRKAPEMAEKIAPKTEQLSAPSTASVAGGLANYQMSKISEANSQMSGIPQKVLGGLSNIATAANAIDTSGSSPSTTSAGSAHESATGRETTPVVAAGANDITDASALQVHNHANNQFQTPRTGNLNELSAITPTTPRFGNLTPTAGYSPLVTTPGGSRARHTCPHCNQAFTRHHNLKSHLLTHSHEKPFLCQTCQARFRRLHDLKRHTKLHTGERPHVCQKCGRRFARGDALARHARAEGGCAGRRGSLAGVAGEDGSIVTGLGGDNDDGMDGLEGLIEDADGDVDMIGESDGAENSRRRSLPTIPTIRTDFSSNTSNPQGTPITPASGNYSSTPNMHHNTYPPLNTPNRTASTAGPSPSLTASLFAPHLGLKGAVGTPGTPVPTSTPTSGGGAGPGGGMGNSEASNSGNGGILSGVLTNSPNEVSPGANQTHDAHNKKPPTFSELMTTFSTVPSSQPQQPQQNQGQQQQQQQQLPQQQQPRENQGGVPVGAPMANMRIHPIQGNANLNLFSAGIEGVWSYIRGLEDRVRVLEATVNDLKQHKATGSNIVNKKTEHQKLQKKAS
jgi:hypothetical protein